MGGIHPLLAWLDREVPTDPRRRTLVVTSSAAGAAALRRALTEHRGALLGVDFVTAAGLARQVLTLGGVPFAEELPDPLEERERLRRNLPDRGVGYYAGRFPGALGHLLATVREVQTLGPVKPRGDLTAAGAEVIALATEFTDALANRGGRSRWIARAIDAVAGGGIALPDRVLVAGYHDAERNLRLLLQLMTDRGVAVRQSADSNGDRPPAPAVRRHSCPTTFAELRLAARQCTDAAERGIAWHEMVVAAPRVALFAGQLRRAFDSEGAPFHARFEAPVLRHPRAALCLHACRLLFGDAPRVSFLALATSPLLRNPVPPEQQARLEYLSRRESLQGTGADARAFADRLEGDTDRPCNAAVALLRAVLDTATRAAQASDNRERSRVLSRFLDRHLRPPNPEDPVVMRIEDCLRAVEFADAQCPTGARYTAELHDLLQTRTVPIAGATTGGVQIVTLRDALAFPCRHLHLLGLSRDNVPGPQPLQTFLGDDDREVLGMQTSDLERVSQQHLLEELLRHAPELTLSHSRTDADGREQRFTQWADKIARVIGLPAEEREPSHPQTRAAARVAAGRCPSDVAVDHLALSGCETDGAFAQLIGEGIRPRGAALESFGGQSLARDGDIGTTWGRQLVDETLSVTAIDWLARCPQRFLFRRVMNIKPLPEEPDPLSLPRDRIGTLIHGVIEGVYEEFASCLRETDRPMGLSQRMAQRAGVLLGRALEGDRSILACQFPGLHRLLESRWRDGLVAAIEADLQLMDVDGARPEAVEHELLHTLTFRRPGDDEEISLRIRGVLDRIDRLAHGGIRVLDFKTGRRPQYSVQAKTIFAGTNLQLVLYAMLARAEMDHVPDELEIRSVRPVGGRGVTPPPYRHELKGARDYLSGKFADGVEETLAILAQLVRRGLFAPNEDRHCSWCEFKSACRRYHPPSAERVQRCATDELAEFHQLAGKSSHEPLLGQRTP